MVIILHVVSHCILVGVQWKLNKITIIDSKYVKGLTQEWCVIDKSFKSLLMTMLEELTTSLCLEFVFSVCRGCKENVRTLVHYRPKKKSYDDDKHKVMRKHKWSSNKRTLGKSCSLFATTFKLHLLTIIKKKQESVNRLQAIVLSFRS